MEDLDYYIEKLDERYLDCIDGDSIHFRDNPYTWLIRMFGFDIGSPIMNEWYKKHMVNDFVVYCDIGYDEVTYSRFILTEDGFKSSEWFVMTL